MSRRPFFRSVICITTRKWVTGLAGAIHDRILLSGPLVQTIKHSIPKMPVTILHLLNERLLVTRTRGTCVVPQPCQKEEKQYTAKHGGKQCPECFLSLFRSQWLRPWQISEPRERRLTRLFSTHRGRPFQPFIYFSPIRVPRFGQAFSCFIQRGRHRFPLPISTRHGSASC